MAPEIKDIKLPNQLTLQYSEKGDMKGTALILLHGFGDSLRTFDLMLPFVPESIHTMVCSKTSAEGSGISADCSSC
ncbi:MAG TPA: hypothetical protein VIK34_07065 [Clostridiaceae bacterium]